MNHIIALILMLATSVGVASDGVAVIYEIDGAAYEGYYVSPAPGAPLVLLVHDWDGLTDYELRRADMLAEQGYAVFAADLFGAGIRPTEVVDRRQHTGALFSDREKMRRLLRGALATAKYNGADVHNAVALGYCFGGAAVLELARSGEALKGFVSIHGGLSTPQGQDYAKTSGKLLILHGAADANISMQDFAQLANELETHGVDHEMIAYGGAPHAFSVFGQDRYRETADRESWVRLTRFLEQTFSPESY